MFVQYFNNGISQSLNVNYCNRKDGIHIHDSSRAHTYVFTKTALFNLPLFLTLPVWKRHEYSSVDIRRTLKVFPCRVLWQLASILNIPISNSAVKISFTSCESMSYGSKSMVVNKIMNHVKKKYKFHNVYKNVLDTKSKQHIPNIPLHTLDNDRFQMLIDLLPKTITSLLDPIYFKKYMVWKDIYIIPIRLETNKIYCARIECREMYNTCIKAQNPSLSNRPLDIRIGDTQYVGLDEVMYFVSQNST